MNDPGLMASVHCGVACASAAVNADISRPAARTDLSFILIPLCMRAECRSACVSWYSSIVLRGLPEGAGGPSSLQRRRRTSIHLLARARPAVLKPAGPRTLVSGSAGRAFGGLRLGQARRHDAREAARHQPAV